MANFHDVFPQVFLDGVNWSDVRTEVDQEATVTTESGLAEEGKLKPSKITWTFLDPADKWRPSSPTSPLYASSGRRMLAAVASDGGLLAVGEASRYKPDSTLGFTAGPPQRGHRWVDFEAEGMLRRINTWTSNVRSPLYRHITGYTNLRGYWPLEDGRNATQSTNATRGGRPGYLQGITLGVDGPLGAESAAQVAASGTALASGWFNTMSATAGYQVHFVSRLKQIPASATAETLFRWSTSTGLDMQWEVSSTTYGLRVVAADGTTLIASGTTFGTGASPDIFIQFRFKVYQSGANVVVEAGWNAQGDAAPLWGNTFTITNQSVGRPVWWRVVNNPNTVEMVFGHVFAVTGISDNLQSFDMQRAFDGYVGERAAARFQRLCRQHNIPWQQIGNTNDTQLMGRQRADTLINLLKEIMVTDSCLIFDRTGNSGLLLRTRRALYQQTPKLALAYGTHVADPLTEVFDDQGVTNVVTVKQVDGSEYTASLDTGPMSTQSPPNGVSDQPASYDVNVFDEQSQLQDLAEWYLAKGTVAGSRWPQVTLDLDRPGLDGTFWTPCSELMAGDRVTISGRTPELIDLLVINVRHVIKTNYRRTAVLTCIPYDPYRVGIYNNGASGHRYAAVDTVLTANLAAGSGGTYSTTHGTLYVAGTSTWGTNTPYDAIVSGERVTVNSVFTSGSGQGLNVTRSVNGVSKTHAAGESVQLADAVRYGL